MKRIGEILKQKRTCVGLSMQQLADKSNLSSAYISEIENNRKKTPPSEDALISIAKALEMNDNEFDEFILLGALERTPDIVKKVLENKDKIISEIANSSNMVSKPSKKSINIPVYEGVTAGTGALLYSDPIDELALSDYFKRTDNLVAFKVKGDSMMPRIENGSYILVKEMLSLSNGEIGVFVVGEEWFVKKYRKIGSFVILSSLNPAYNDIEIDLDNCEYFSCVGKVIMVQNFI